MNEMRKFILSIFLVLPVLLSAQEVISPLTVNGEQAWESRNAIRTVVFPTDTVALPSSGIRDNFMYDSHRPDSSMWDLSLNPGVYVNRGWATAPINIGVCTFDGLGANGYPYNPLASVNSSELCDVLTSRHFDLTAYDPSDSVYLSFWWEAQGRGYAPNQADSLQLQVNIPAWNTSGEVWKTIWFMEGYNPNSTDTSFHIAMVRLDSASYFTSGFRFRFRNYASACGSNDHWHIDEVLFKPNRTYADTLINDVFFVYGMPSLLKDFSAVPGDHYSASLMADSIHVYIRNNDTINRNVTYSFDVFEPGNTTPLYTYLGGADGNLIPFDSAGYSNYAPHERPNFSFAYPGFTSPDTGYYYVNHMLKKGTSASAPIDTVTYNQRMYNYYAYDDGTAEVGYGIYGPNALLAYKFTLPPSVTDTLTAVQMHFLPVLDIDNLQYRQFKLTVWNHNSSTNGPGAIIYQQAGESPYYAPDVPNRFATYTIDSGTVILSGTYYIGWQQLAQDRLYIGLDYSNDQKDKIYYNTSGVWYTSIYSASIMMRPVFGSTYDVSGISEGNGNSSLNVYPNPASENIRISGLHQGQSYNATVFDLSGREVKKQSVNEDNALINVADLTPGIYLVRVTDENGVVSGTEKVIVQ